MSLYCQCFGNQFHQLHKQLIQNICSTSVEKNSTIQPKSENNKIVTTFPPRKISLRRSFKLNTKIHQSRNGQDQQMPQSSIKKAQKESFTKPFLNKFPNYSISLSNSPQKYNFFPIPTKNTPTKNEKNIEAFQTGQFIQQKQLAKANITISYISPTEIQTAHSRNDSTNRDYQQFQTHKNSFVSLEWKQTSLGTSQAYKSSDKHFSNIMNNSVTQNRFQPFRWMGQQNTMKTQKTIMKTQKSLSLLGTSKLVPFKNEDQQKSQKTRRNSVCKSLRSLPKQPYHLQEINCKRAESIIDAGDELQNEFSEVIMGTRKNLIENKIGKKKELNVQNIEHFWKMNL